MGIGQPRPQWAGTEGVVKKEGKEDKKCLKTTPSPQSGLLWGTRLGSLEKLPRGGEVPTPPLCLGGQTKSVRIPHWTLEGPVFDCPLRGQ